MQSLVNTKCRYIADVTVNELVYFMAGIAAAFLYKEAMF